MSQFWIEIADGVTDVRYGTLRTALAWESSDLLDRVGAFRFLLPAADPQIDLLRVKRVARCFSIVQDEVHERGAGVIERISLGDTEGAPVIQVEGSDLLTELANEQVGELWLQTETLEHADSVTVLDANDKGALNVVHTCTEAIDNAVGDTTTYWEIPADGSGKRKWNGDGTVDFIYVKHNKQFDLIQYRKGAGALAASSDYANPWRVQYYDGQKVSWEDLSLTVETTKIGNILLAQDGEIAWDLPETWGILDGTYQVRIWAENNGGSGPDGITLGDIAVGYTVPTTDGLAQLMGRAPTGWSLDAGGGYTATAEAVQLEYSGESDFEALARLAEQTGEHFIRGEGRTVRWLGIDERVLDLWATNGGDAQAQQANPYIAHILRLNERQEAYELASRVYIYGGTTGDQRATLANTSRSAPTGYTLNAAENYIERTGVPYRRKDKYLEFADIVPWNAGLVATGYAADMLFDRGLIWLQTHSASNLDRLDGDQPRAFDMEVAANRIIRAGYLLRTTFIDAADALILQRVDQPLWLLGVTLRMSANGAETYALETATVDALARTDAESQVSEARINRAIRRRAGLPLSTNNGGIVLTGSNNHAALVNLTYADSGHTGFQPTITDGSITLAKLANMATASLIYRKTAGDGAPEVNSLATLKTDLGSMPAAAHNVLDSTYHGDVLTGSVVRGDILYGNATPKLARLALGGIAGSVLTRDATDMVWSAGGLAFAGAFTLTVPATGTALLATGIAGGQTLIGGTVAGDNLVLKGADSGTGGEVRVQMTSSGQTARLMAWRTDAAALLSCIQPDGRWAFGPGIAPAVGVGHNLSYAFSGSLGVAQQVVSSYSGTGTVYGALLEATVTATTANVANSYGAFYRTRLTSANAHTITGTTAAVNAELYLAASNALSATTAHLFLGSIVVGAQTGTIGTLYGLRLPDITLGGTNNYAVATGKGLNVLGDQLAITGWADRAQLTVTGHTTQAVATGLVAFTRNDAAAGVSRVLTLTSLGSGADGDGGSINLLGKSSTTAAQNMGLIEWYWPATGGATHASRFSRMVFSVYDAAGTREGLRIEASGSAAKIGFLGAAAVVRQTGHAAPTDDATTLTFCAAIRTALQSLGLITTV